MQKLSEQQSCLLCPIDSTEFIRTFKDPTWGEFSGFWLIDQDNDFRDTMKSICCNYIRNVRFNISIRDNHSMGNSLPPEVLNRIGKQCEQIGMDKDQRDNVIEVIALIAIMASLEAEYYGSYQPDSLFLKKILPKYIDRKKQLVATPIELFFQKLLRNLVSKGLFKDRDHLVEELEFWLEDPKQRDSLEQEEIIRYINRYRSGENVQSWKSYNRWAKLFATQVVRKTYAEDSKDITHEELIQSEVYHSQNLFGGALLFDRAFRLSHEVLTNAGFDPVCFFRNEYCACVKSMQEGGTEKPFPL
jgi:Arc/MetJ-type ribon-helix-helix transcriptional regulator